MRLILIFIFLTNLVLLKIQVITHNFDHHAILFDNLDPSSTFYQDKMGLKEIEDKTKQDQIV